MRAMRLADLGPVVLPGWMSRVRVASPLSTEVERTTSRFATWLDIELPAPSNHPPATLKPRSCYVFDMPPCAERDLDHIELALAQLL